MRNLRLHKIGKHVALVTVRSGTNAGLIVGQIMRYDKEDPSYVAEMRYLYSTDLCAALRWCDNVRECLEFMEAKYGNTLRWLRDRHYLEVTQGKATYRVNRRNTP